MTLLIKIRPAYSQIDTVRELFNEYTRMLGVNLDFQKYDEELDSLPGKYALPDGRLYIAILEGLTAGCIGLRRFDHSSCEMKRLFVRPQFRGLKIGRLLAEQVIRDAKRMGYKHMVLDTLTQLETASVLYRNLGFYEIEPYYLNPLDQPIYMRLDL